MTDHDESLANDPMAVLVRNSAPEQFDSGFSSRVLERLRAEREPALSAELQRHFVRIVPLAAAATLMLAAYNWWGARGTAASPIDAALNLPQVTLATAYSAASLYGVAGASETP